MMINLPPHLEARLLSIQQKIANILSRIHRCEQKLQLVSCEAVQELETLSTYVRREASIPTISPYDDVRLSLSEDSILWQSDRMDVKTFTVMKESILATSEELKRVDHQMFKIKQGLEGKVHELEQGLTVMGRIMEVVSGEQSGGQVPKSSKNRSNNPPSSRGSKGGKKRQQTDFLLQKYLPVKDHHFS